MGVDTLLAVITATAESQGANALFSPSDYAPTPSPAPTYTESNAAVQMTQSGSAWTGVRADVGKRTGKWYFEIEMADVGSAQFAVGLAASDGSIGAEPGSDAYTLAAIGGLGIATWKFGGGTDTDGDADDFGISTNLGVCVDLESRCVWVGSNSVSGAAMIFFGAGDPELGTDPTFSGLLPLEWYPAVWSNSTAKFRIIHSGFQYTPPAGYRSDWYAINYVETIKRLSNNGYSAYDGATWRHFLARIKGDPTIERAVSCIVWGDRRVNGAFGELVMINNDGGLDYLITEQGWRGAKVELYEGDRSTALTAFTRTAVLYIDDIRATGERDIRATLRDRSIQLDVPANPNGNQLILGRAYSCPVVAMESGTYNYIASEAEFIEFMAVRDKGVLLDFGTGYGYLPSTAGEYGLDLVTEPAGRVVCDIWGAFIVDETIVTGASGGDFTTWSAGAPVGWTTVETGGDTIQQDGTSANFIVTSIQYGSIAQGSLLSGSTYFWRVDITDATSGTLELVTSDGSTWWPALDSVGRHQGIAAGTADSSLVKIQTAASAAADITIDEVRVARVRTTEKVARALPYLLSLAGIAESDFASADATLIQQVFTGECGGCWPRTESIASILDDYARSWCGWWYWDIDDVLRIGRLKGPDAAASLAITGDMVFGDINVETDRAPGLSSIVAGQRNWSPYSDDDLVPVGASMTASVRAELQKDFRIRVSGVGTVAAEYGHAVGASAIGRCTPEAQRLRAGIATLWNSSADCQRLADELTTIYSRIRRFWRLSAFLSRADAYALEIGQTVTLTGDRFGLDDGVKLVVIGISRRPLSNLVTLRLWG